MVSMQYSNNQQTSVSPGHPFFISAQQVFHRYTKTVLVCCFGIALQLGYAQTPSVTNKSNLNASSAQAEVVGIYFTPPSDVAAAVIEVIDQSKTEVLVQAYGFTHNGIAQALLRAHARGVLVKVLLDAKTDSTNRYVTELLQAQQIPLRLDAGHAIAHNKVIVVDGELVITGSFNFTNSAQTRNAENLLVLKSSGLAESYKSNWQTHWNHSR